MNPKEAGFLLLSSHLGDPERPVLTTAQLRMLACRVRDRSPEDPDRDTSAADLTALGYSRGMAARIVGLLEETERLRAYLRRGAALDCCPISRVSPAYPALLLQRLGLDSPGCLWAKGDVSILRRPAIALVGSRALREPNRAFARQVGREAALRGLVLISGNARGADRTAQQACLAAGGQVISIVADDLSRQPLVRNVLYLSEDGFDEPFSAQRALSRNRCIHALGQMVFVAQADFGKGGTWDGTMKNLRFGWSSVVCFQDGSPAAAALEQQGAYFAGLHDLPDFFSRDAASPPEPGQLSLFEPASDVPTA